MADIVLSAELSSGFKEGLFKTSKVGQFKKFWNLNSSQFLQDASGVEIDLNHTIRTSESDCTNNAIHIMDIDCFVQEKNLNLTFVTFRAELNFEVLAESDAKNNTELRFDR